MSFKQLFDQAVKNQTYETLNIIIKEWKEENDTLIGRLKKIDEFVGEFVDNPCKCYVFETDNGVESCVLGTVSDKILNAQENIGKVFAITFRGKNRSKKGVEYNDFQILRIKEGK